MESKDKDSPTNADSVQAAATDRYRENLMKDLNLAFDRKSKLPDVSVSFVDDPHKKAHKETKAFEETINKIYEESNSKRRSTFNKAYEYWAAVAQEAASTPEMPPKHFEGQKWFFHDDGTGGPQNGDEAKIIDLPTRNELHKIAKELLLTERTYVTNLRFLDQIFHKRMLKASEQNVIPESVANQIFQHLSAIFYFHSMYLLPQLEQRLLNWENDPRIGDIMMQAGPFLKMYAMYINNHKTAQETVQTWKKKSKQFSLMIAEIQKEETEGLSLESCMLTPVQRTPRYKLMLEKYLSKLPDGAAQRKEVETALELVSVAASHSDQYIAQTENSLKLMKIYEGIANLHFDTGGCSRELLKEGSIVKIAARSGKENSRYLYLFNDMLLCCKECSSMQRIQGKTYQISVTFTLEGLIAVADEKRSHRPVFFLNGIEKHMELLCSSIEDRDDWVRAINDAVNAITKNKTSSHHLRSKSSGEVERGFSASSSLMFTQKDGFLTPQAIRKEPIRKNCSLDAHTRKNYLNEEVLGLRAPQWVKDYDVTMCMTCSSLFHPLLRRRHHCRACGRVVCSTCSKRSVVLPYQPTSPQRVCDPCFLIFNRVGISSRSADEDKQLGSENDSLLSAFFNVQHKQKWSRLWCVVPKNTPQMCICFKAKMDSKPFLLLGFNGCQTSPVNKDERDERSWSFELKDILENKYVFASDNNEEVARLHKLIKNNLFEKVTVYKSVSVA